MLVEKSGTLKELLKLFSDEVYTLANHLFIAKWQYKQFNTITKNVPKGWLVSIADFSENYRCVNQDEI